MQGVANPNGLDESSDAAGRLVGNERERLVARPSILLAGNLFPDLAAGTPWRIPRGRRLKIEDE